MWFSEAKTIRQDGNGRPPSFTPPLLHCCHEPWSGVDDIEVEGPRADKRVVSLATSCPGIKNLPTRQLQMTVTPYRGLKQLGM